MTFGEAVRSGFNNYTTWRGRASRSEFWWWYLFTVLVTLPFNIIWQVSIAGQSFEDITSLFNWAYFLFVIVALVLFLPTLAMTIRRLHDTNRSGGWYWILLVPFAGSIILLVFMLLPSAPGPNRFDS
jgi:uncharacterized membrane protein YhaH (DUF805 family)